MPATPSLPVYSPAAPRTKGERTAERVLDAAEALFAERGYAGTTLRDVAERVGLRIPSLYNHFDSKESLYAAVLHRGIGPLFGILADFVEQGRRVGRDSGPLVHRVMQQLARRPHLPRLVQHEMLTGGQHLTPLLREFVGPILARANEIVASSPAARGWRSEEIPLLVLALFHIVVGYFTVAPVFRELNGEDLLSPEAIARQTRFLSELTAKLFTDEE